MTLLSVLTTTPFSIPRDNFEGRVALVKKLLEGTSAQYEPLHTYLTEEQAKGKIENFVGAVPVPLGLCGPLDIRGQFTRGKFVVPMATLEGALIASYSRGAKIINESGGCETLVYGDSFLRAAQFTTRSLAESAQLIEWCKSHAGEIREVIHRCSSVVSLLDMSYECLGDTVIVSIRLGTGDAMGSNIGSKSVGALCDYVTERSGLVADVTVPYPEDKKYIPMRRKGKMVIARAVLKREPFLQITRSSLEQLAQFIANFKNMLALHGGCSLNVHAANGMAAMFQAFGQDMAYMGECSQAILDCHFVEPDALAVSLTLPTLIIGTVGGGTGLPAFQATLAMVDCCGSGKARKLAEIMAAVILAGEIGCAAAHCAHEFIPAHERLGKNRPRE